jgi:hypothetical protein
MTTDKVKALLKQQRENCHEAYMTVATTGLDEEEAILSAPEPIDYTNYEQLAEDVWLFLTNDKRPEKATIKKAAFIHEVKVMIETAVLFNKEEVKDLGTKQHSPD